jgi:hypothetical protein
MKSFQLATAVTLATSTMAMAQDSVQISYSGVLSVEHLSGPDYRDDYFHGNGNVSFRWSTDSHLKFGVDLGVETFGLFNNGESFDELSSYYASGIVEGQFGKISIGMPRGIIDDYFSVPEIAGSELIELELLVLGSDLVRYVKLFSDEEGENLHGIRYDGKIGRIEVAASVLKASEYINGIRELVVRYEAGHWSVTLGTSHFEIEGSSVNSTSLEFQGNAGNFSGGIVYNNLYGDDIDQDTARAFFSYDVNDAIKINAQVLDFQIFEGSDDKIYGLDLLYKHKTDAFVNAGVFTNDTFANKVFNVSVGYKF